jgi:membrane dipeptidase
MILFPQDKRWLVWDQHTCVPYGGASTLSVLERHRRAGVDLVSVNVGFDGVSCEETMTVLARLRSQILSEPESLLLVESAPDVGAAQESGRLAVTFDIEGAVPLAGEPAMVGLFYALGVRTMLMTYNVTNSAGGGCHGDPAQGLTSYGREILGEMNRVGMVVDASHCAYQTTMDLFALSTSPVIFSHVAPRGLVDHPRNVDDDQIRECAATGGVIGLAGVSAFLGDPLAGVDALFRAVDYVVDLVGPQHVGLGLDHIGDLGEVEELLKGHGGLFPSGAGYDTSLNFFDPENIPLLTREMLDHGYPETAVRGILGENFFRVATAVWADKAAP